MIKIRFFAACLFLPGLLFAANENQHVVLISLDGFPAWLWRKPDLPVPNLRRLAAEGTSAAAMTVSNPSITWINHTTMITGVSPRKHGVLYNGLLVRPGTDKPPFIEQWADKTLLVHVPTLYDVAHAAGLTSAESDWVAITHAKTVDWSFPEIPSPTGRVENEMIAAGLLTKEQIGWMQFGPQRKNLTWHDETWTKAAVFMFTQHHPNLLMLHPLGTDAANHNYGPGSDASYTALAYADRLVGEMIRAVDESGLRAQTTFIITTDHGFKKVERHVYPNVALRKAGYVTTNGAAVTQCSVYTVVEGGIAFVYVTDPTRKAEFLPRLKTLLASTEGIDQVIDGHDGPKLGMPTPEENQGMGDLVLYAKAGYAFDPSATGDEVAGPSLKEHGSHGYPSSDPELDGIFIIAGPGIKKGLKIPRMSNLNIAPTIARILDLDLPGMERPALDEAFELSAVKAH